MTNARKDGQKCLVAQSKSVISIGHLLGPNPPPPPTFPHIQWQDPFDISKPKGKGKVASPALSDDAIESPLMMRGSKPFRYNAGALPSKETTLAKNAG